MAKLIQKSGFLSKKRAGRYMKYIATRDGVEILNEDAEGIYMRYIATRPRAEKHEGHGLFGAEPHVDLEKTMQELKTHEGNVWTIIYSLRREDAARLGYDNAESWRLALLAHQNDFAETMQIPLEHLHWYDAAEGLLTSVILLLAEYVPPDSAGHEKRHIVSVFKLVQELLAPSGQNKKTGFQVLMDNLPSTHKARWFAGAALNTSEQGMASVMSTVLSRLNAFLDSELEQVLCFDSAIDAEHFAAEKSAIFLVLPEEDNTKNFMAGLMIQNLSRELFSVADEHGGKLQNRVVFYCDELGTMPPFDILPLFSAGRSRKLTLVPIIQSLAQLEKNYGKEGAEIIGDNCQDTIFGGFAPNSQTAETLSKALGSRTVLTGSVSKGKDNTSQSLQMAERALLSPDELKNLPKGNFIVMKTGTHPMRTKLQLYFKWGIQFEEPYQVPERAQREVYYAGKEELLMNIKKNLYSQPKSVSTPKADDYMSSYGDK